MNPLTTLLISLQETLPPPPTPTGSPEIDTAQVVGVVIISLALITIGALALRPFVTRNIKALDTSAEPGTETTPTADAAPPSKSDAGTRSIIQFPKAVLTPAMATDQPWAWTEAENSIEDRFKRVISESGRRRKLGDRQPNVSTVVAPTRIRTFATEPGGHTSQRSAPLILSPIVPLSDRRMPTVAERQSVMVAEPEEAVIDTGTEQPIESAQLAVVAPLESVESTEPFIVIRRGEDILSVVEDVETVQTQPVEAPIAGIEDWQTVIDELDLEGNSDASVGEILIRGDRIDEPDDVEDMLREAESGGAAPSEADLELVAMAHETVVVELESEISAPPVNLTQAFDDRTLAGISQTVRDLIYCANAGKLINGFALYSDPYLFRFMDSTGLDETGFRERFTSIPPRPAAEWERLDRLSDLVRQPDGRIVATVSYVDNNGRPTNGVERFRFEYSVESDFWMIDDIQSLEAN